MTTLPPQCPYVQQDVNNENSWWNCTLSDHDIGDDGQQGHQLPPNGPRGTGPWINARRTQLGKPRPDPLADLKTEAIQDVLELEEE